jgi:hypothetical protein
MNDAHLTLRDRLTALRADALARLASGNGIDTGMLELVAHIGIVLSSLDGEADAAVPPEPGDRCIVSDDNREIMVTVYSSDRRAAAAVLSPAAAIRLAGQLISSASRRL